ncbi:DUF2207 domain-containing protein [Neolewinella maritima]|uniref:DUF2207 domain-containing protein n=1 Tax=Neolewinella maritima TaxID=1383882 RepID=UPI001EE98632|nr:DUF2207 domain-containing protein [Neolewinella maritima]
MRYLLFVVLPFLASPAILFAQERFRTWHTEIVLHTDRSAEVTETITVVAEGRSVKRGITRTFPAPVKLLDVRRDGRSEPYHTDRKGGGVTLYVGQKDKLISPGTYTYRLRYRIEGAVLAYDSLDELSFDLIGPKLDFLIEQLTAMLQYPADALPVQYACYTGSVGDTERACSLAPGDPQNLIFTGRGTFGQGRVATVAVGFAPGVFAVADRAAATPIPPSSPAHRYGLLGVLLVGGFIAYRYALSSWREHGVDPPAPATGARYAPPHGYSPAELAYLSGRGGSAAGFTASLLDLATRGYLRIEEGRTHFELHKTNKDLPPDPAPEQQLLYRSLFDGAKRVKLRQSYDKKLRTISNKHDQAVAERHPGFLYQGHNSRRVLPLFLILLLTVLTAVLLIRTDPAHAGIGYVAVFGVLSLIAIGVYWYAIAQPSPEKVRLLAEIKAFRTYLSMSEKKRRALPDAPEMTVAHYEELLPYAIALGVHTKWSDYFGELLTVQNYRPHYAMGGRAFSANHFSTQLSSTVQQATVAPSQSSGGGGSAGGGSSGGGGAGGW